MLNGQVIGKVNSRFNVGRLVFLRQTDRQAPKGDILHSIADNHATYKHPAVNAWLDKDQRVHLYFTPTSASRLNMVERFFRDITTQQLRRWMFTSVPELIQAIEGYLNHHKTHLKPFIWTKADRDILQKVIAPTTT